LLGFSYLFSRVPVVLLLKRQHSLQQRAREGRKEGRKEGTFSINQYFIIIILLRLLLPTS